MGLMSRVKVYYDLHFDSYRFVVTTPNINYMDAPAIRAGFKDDPLQPIVVKAKTLASMKMVVQVPSELIINDWETAKQTILLHIQMAITSPEHHPELDDKILHTVLDSIRTKLDSKSAIDWMVSADSSPYIKQDDTPLSKLKDSLPGLRVIMGCPVKLCSRKTNVWYLIVHLNDTHKWKREQIADWLDTLDVDLSFKVEEDE